MGSSLSNLTVAQLHRAAQIKQQIEDLEHELGSILGGGAVSKVRGRVSGRGKGQISAAGRARIAAAQKARWARERQKKS